MTIGNTDLDDGATPEELPGAYVYTHGVLPPEGEWGYAVDDHSIVYGAGSWPFFRVRTDNGRVQRTGVRVSPDVEFYSWGNEYVELAPSWWDEAFAEATLKLYAGRRRAALLVVDGKIRLDLNAGVALIHDTIPAPLRDQAQMKADRLLAMVTAHRRARDNGVERPLTAYQTWRRQQQDDRPDPTT